MNKVSFPNESKSYRAARNDLLKAEIDLRRQIEKVAALRRSLPAGGEVPEDYVFDSERGKVKLSQLFERGSTLVAYSFMYGPKMQKPCPMCSAILDGLNGNAQHIAQRANLVVVAKSPLERHVDLIWPLLNLLDFTPEGRGADWYPKLSY